MTPSVALPGAVSPLSRLTRDEREQVFAILIDYLDPADLVPVLAAFAGSRGDVAGLSPALQARVQAVILAALPPGLNVIVVSATGIGLESDEKNLESVLTDDEKDDVALRQRVEQIAHERRIPRWLALQRVREEGLDADQVIGRRTQALRKHRSMQAGGGQ
jgi:hypothetical protein